MKMIHQSAAIIRPKRAFIKWANSCSPDGNEYDAKYFNTHVTVLLIPYFIFIHQARKHITEHWEIIFNEELHRWNEVESLWPKDRTLKMFQQWFSFEFHSHIIDATGDCE